MKRFTGIILGLLLFLSALSGCGGEKNAAYGEELLNNGGFEIGTTAPADWEFSSWQSGAELTLNTHTGNLDNGGDRYAVLHNTRQNKSVLGQRVKVVKNAVYKLSGYIRVDIEINSKRSEFSGAHLGIKEYNVVPSETFIVRAGWQYYEMYFKSVDYAAVTIEARIGSDSRDARGQASFDNVSLVRVEKSELPATVEIASVTKPSGTVSGGEVWAWIAGIVFTIGSVLAVLYFCKRLKIRGKLNKKALLIIIFGAALVLRLIIGFLIQGHKYDMSCWRAWGVQLANSGPWNFYILDGDVTQLNWINDYVPGYMYVLWLLGGIKNLFGMGYNSMAYYGLVKLPAILADIGCGYLIYKIARKRFGSVPSLVAASLFLFNPFVIVNSAAWGQIESVTALFTLATVYLVLQKKFFLSGLAFTGGVLFKFQTVFIFPVYAAYLVYEAVKHRQLRWRLPLYLLSYLAVFYIICLPFTVKQIGAGDVLFPFKLYFNQIDRYNEYTLNAFNLFTLFGLNRVGFADKVAVGAVNYAVLAALSAASVFLFLKSRRKSILFLTGALLVTAVCMFSVKVHERYLYPGIVLILAAFLTTKDKRLLGIFCAFSLIHYVNTVVILLRDAGDFKNGEFLLVFFSLASILLFLYFAYVTMSIVFKKKTAAPLAAAAGIGAMKIENITGGAGGNGGEQTQKPDVSSPTVGNSESDGKSDEPENSLNGETAQEESVPEQPEQKKARAPYRPKTRLQIVTRELVAKENISKRRLSKRDWIVMAVLTVIAAVLAFSYLGGFTVPETYWETSGKTGSEDYVILAKPAESVVGEVWVYTGIPEGDGDNRFTVSFGSGRDANASDWQLGGEFTAVAGGMYKWAHFSAYKQAKPSPFVKIATAYAGARVLEVVLVDKDTGKAMENVVIDSGLRETAVYSAVLDEQDTFTGKNSLMTDMYFDEIYHVRTAFELIQGWDIYEWTHPPLGKEIIALGILMFGMNPFGWRFMSALFSVALIPVAYLLGKRLFRNTWLSGILAGLFAIDGLRMVQGRIGTLDAISVFFILLSFFFMLLFTEGNFNKKGQNSGRGLIKHLSMFAASGIVFGLSVATKWTGVYAGLGLLAMFVYYVMKRGREYVVAKEHLNSPKRGALFSEVKRFFTRNMLLTVGAGATFFLLVPFVIYLLSYIPTYRAGFSYLVNDGSLGFFDHFWENQVQMLAYHGGLKEGHKSASIWATWLLDIKGVFFYNAGSSATGVYARIQSMGTPVLYWCSFAALIYYIYYLINMRLRVRRGEVDPEDKLYRSNLRILGVLFIGLLSNLLPWVFVTRATFIYHFFPSTLFYFGFLALLFRQIYYDGNTPLKKIKVAKGFTVTVTSGKIAILAVCFLIVLNFALFYPLFSGVPLSITAANGLFRWIQFFGAHFGI